MFQSLGLRDNYVQQNSAVVLALLSTFRSINRPLCLFQVNRLKNNIISLLSFQKCFLSEFALSTFYFDNVFGRPFVLDGDLAPLSK